MRSWTGAAGAIGRAIAMSLSRRGCHLALADVIEEGILETGQMALANGARVSRHRLDVSDHQAVAAFPKAVMAEHAGVDIPVNNAGVAVSGTFDEVSEDNFEWLFEINFWGVVRMTHAFLPRLKASDDGQRAYSASKLRKNNGATSVRSNKTRRPSDRSRDLVH